MIIKSDIAGSVWKIETKAGQAVAEGEVLMILESMKMEIPVEAPAAGVVAEILVAAGQAIAEDQPLAVIDRG
jgi:biotin carboxyl carrier protein